MGSRKEIDRVISSLGSWEKITQVYMFNSHSGNQDKHIHYVLTMKQNGWNCRIVEFLTMRTYSS